ncbi:sterol desaturase family protein [Seonamhaeicola maritimus]|uniref:sterol desaturase family protein n=1 Tax=Seonamhaeicola maritimus TaxID=2591822 RepID=UPI0024955304|nr:sterol desaturase family protein [Seonamhaeicola maritimus]
MSHQQSSSFWKKVYSYIETPFLIIEKIGYKYILGPFRWVLSLIDPLAEKIEGTLFKRILQVIIYPLFLTLCIYIGFELIEGGYTIRTFFGTIVMFLIFGAIFAPLEHLIPFSKKWLDDKEMPTDVMLFFGGKFWGDYINAPIKLATITLVVQEISPTIGQNIWPSGLHSVLQVFILLSAKDFFRYWYHRWMHESEFMWSWHAVHHSSTRLYWFNGTRSHPLEGLIASILWGIPLAFIQAPVEIVFVTGILGRTIGRFQHTNMDLILGPFDYIFSSPKNHRYHHSKKVEEGNSNYGGDVIFWDILFGTFYLPKGKTPSDDIGVGGMPNYPQTFLGLMLAPFNYRKIKREAEAIEARKVNADK